MSELQGPAHTHTHAREYANTNELNHLFNVSVRPGERSAPSDSFPSNFLSNTHCVFTAVWSAEEDKVLLSLLTIEGKILI